jgi:hypothetical protein
MNAATILQPGERSFLFPDKLKCGNVPDTKRACNIGFKLYHGTTSTVSVPTSSKELDLGV